MFDINKEKEAAAFVIAKKGIPIDQKMAVVLDLDVSGSARSLFSQGLIQELVQGVVPLALRFDDNESLQVFTFAAGDDYVTEISPDCTADNYSDYVQKKILDNKSVQKWGGTHYSEVIMENLASLGYYTEAKKGGLFGFGSSSVKKLRGRNDSGFPSLIIVFTDGANSDQAASKQILQECQDSSVNAYFLFIGVGSKTEFRNIEKLGDVFDNVGFVSAENIDKFLHDGNVYDKLIPQELVDWLKKS